MISIGLSVGHSSEGMYCVVSRRYNSVSSAEVSMHTNICPMHHAFA